MIPALITIAVSFAAAFALYSPFITALRRWKAGQVIQEELPDIHQVKAGTPTAGSAPTGSPFLRLWRARTVGLHRPRGGTLAISRLPASPSIHPPRHVS